MAFAMLMSCIRITEYFDLYDIDILNYDKKESETTRGDVDF
jgi:hypothetical protein